MGNDQAKPTKIAKLAQKAKFASPMSPKKNVKTTPKVATPAVKFDWLDCYTPTPQRPNPQELPSDTCFQDWILYRDQVLGEGAFAKVIMATHKQTHAKAAVKVITKAAIPEDMRDYVVKEPGVLAQLDHKNIVKLLLVHEDKDFIYMFLKYLPGGDLHSRLEREGVFDEDLARNYFKQMITALETVHTKGYCHRDLKLENMLIIGEGKDAKIILIDFGFAAEMLNGGNYLFRDFPGSVSYAAPELLQGIPYKGHSADIYSLGVILYTLIQGMYPFYSEDRREMFQLVTKGRQSYEPQTSTAARELLDWMLQKKPEDRPTLEQIKSHRFVAGNKPVPGTPMSPIKQINRIKNAARASLSPKSSRRRQSMAQ